MFSIDQNCQPLWDVIPKLHVLCRRFDDVTHFVEDIDVAFTSMGADLEGKDLHLTKERFYRSGGGDWGAAMFYSEFLGKLPVEIRHWEPFTGMKTRVLAKELARSVDDLYDEFSPGDNWQLTGPSYVGDRSHHRVIGDLTVAETAPFLRELLDLARCNTLHAFPEPQCQQRTNDWFDQEQRRLEDLIRRCEGGRLVELYRNWLGEYVGESVGIDMTSSLLQIPGSEQRLRILEIFISNYDQATRVYNDAVEESGSGLRELRTSIGELPMFAVMEHHGHLVRCAAYLRDGAVHVEDKPFPPTSEGRMDLQDL